MLVSIRGRLISFQRIMQEPLPPTDWLVEKIIPAGNRGVLFGEFGCYKSWLLLHLGLHIAAGRSWLGQFLIPQPRSVLFIDEEMSEVELRRRVKQLAEGAGLQTEDLPFRAVSHAGIRCDERQIPRLLEDLRLEGFDPDTVMVETFRRILVGSENEASDVSRFWLNVSPIFEARKTLILSHHMRKPGQMGAGENRYRASGSTDILAGADCSFAVTRRGEIVTLECTKQRCGPENQPFDVKLHEPQGKDGPKELLFTGFHNANSSVPTEEQRAVEVLRGYASGLADIVVRTSDILDYLQTQGIKQRTGERVLKQHGSAYLDHVSTGKWRRRSQAA
ncbi:hypothetical protein YTPLAS18_20610 [Nitrospira sp.]|nr:hypothetical protein YTPLAS18_20610 [Nitrospira sp.]